MSDAWIATTVGEIASICFSSVDKHILPGERHIRLCNYMDVYRNRRISSSIDFAPGSATPNEISRFQLQKGDVLVTKDSETPDDIGLPAVVTEDLPDTICGYHLALIRPKEGIDSRFVGYHFLSNVAKRHFLQTATGVTRFGLGIRALNSLPISLPSLSEQAAIAHILNALDMTILRAQVAVTKALDVRNSLLAELLSRGVDDHGQVRDPVRFANQFTKTSLGLLPRDWRLSKIGNEFDLQNGFTINASQQSNKQLRRYLRVANVHRDNLRLDDIQELQANDNEFAPRVLELNDLLVVEGHADRMQIGRCARVNEQAIGLTFQNHLFRLRTKGEILPYFACLWLNSAYAQRYWNAQCATSSGLNTINQRMLKRMLLPVPSEPEQQIIETLIEKQRNHLDALRNKLSTFIELKKSLMHDLLTGTVRVDPALFKEITPL